MIFQCRVWNCLSSSSSQPKVSQCRQPHSFSLCLCERTMLQCSEFRGEECDNRMELWEELLHLRPQGMHQRWAEAEHLFTVVRDDKRWAAEAGAAGLWHPGGRLETWNSEFISSKRTFELAFCKKKTCKKETKNQTGIRLIRHLCALWAAGMGGSEECRSALQRGRWKAERWWLPGRHKEVDLAVKLRVMCLHLNEKARKGKRDGGWGGGNTGWAKRPGTLPSRDTWGMHQQQQQQLSLCSNTIIVSAIWVRKTARQV